MDDLDELLGIDMNDPTQRLAIDLVDGDRDLIDSLVNVRQNADLSRADVAKRMGISVAAVGNLESFSSDPSLSTLRRYALAVGALVTHKVHSG
jgi:DNA-binding XRE family transcriptional regulator